VDHLIALGRQRIGMITSPPTLRAAADRVEGYRQALRVHGRPVDETLIVEGGYGECFGYERMQSLLARGVDAAFVSSDIMALGALRAVLHAGLRVPEDVAIVGFDDVPAAATADPPLTTVHQDIEQFGGQAVQALISILAGEITPPYQQTLPTRLVIRDSCGANLR